MRKQLWTPQHAITQIHTHANYKGISQWSEARWQPPSTINQDTSDGNRKGRWEEQTSTESTPRTSAGQLQIQPGEQLKEPEKGWCWCQVQPFPVTGHQVLHRAFALQNTCRTLCSKLSKVPKPRKAGKNLQLHWILDLCSSRVQGGC